MLILHPTQQPLVRTRGPADWQAYLADPEKHWKAVPEYCVPLPGGRAASQNDLYVLGRIGPDLAVMMVEGKVDESFGPLLEEWLRDASDGKRERLAFLKSTLGIATELPGQIRYQLLHRAASPVIEAMRVGARYAAMIVHSFSPSDAWLEDYRAFARLMGVEGGTGRLERVARHVGVELWMGWVGGSASVPLTAEENHGPLSSRFDTALRLASEVHRQHLRKGTTVPYMSHLLSVAALVLEDGGDEDEAIAALLHDALEDHPDRISAADIEAKFGSKVRELVLACTDTPPGFVGGEKPEWKTRKLAYLSHIRSGEIPWRVSLADKLHNARCILRDHRLVNEAIWERFTASKDETLWYYRSLAEAYRDAGAGGFMIDELERVLRELEATVGG